MVDLTKESEGFKVLGVPFGGDNYVRCILNETASKVNIFCDRVEEPEHPQIGVLLLRSCCGTCRVVRGSNHQVMSDLAQAVDTKMFATLQRILGLSSTSSAAVQVSFPKMGGLGFTRAVDLVPLAAFTSRWSFEWSGQLLVHFPPALFARLA